MKTPDEIKKGLECCMNDSFFAKKSVLTLIPFQTVLIVQ